MPAFLLWHWQGLLLLCLLLLIIFIQVNLYNLLINLQIQSSDVYNKGLFCYY